VHHSLLLGFAVAAAAFAAGCTQRTTEADASDLSVGASAASVARLAQPTAQSVSRGTSGSAALTPVAGLPDRGTFAVYTNPAQAHRTGPYTWYPVSLSEAHLLGAAAGAGQVRLTAPDGSSLNLRYLRHVPHADGIWTWIGRSDVPGLDDAIITFGQHSVFGTIPQRHGLPLRITMRDGRAWIVTTDPAQVRDLGSTATRPRRPDFRIPPRTTDAAPAEGVAAADAAVSGSVTAYSTTDRQTIDLVLGYTTGLNNQWVSASMCTALGAAQCEKTRNENTLTRLNFLVDVTNQAYVNSGVGAQVNLVRTVKVAYPDATSNETTLNALTGYNGSAWSTPNAAFAGLRAARDQYGADLVSLVRKFTDPENDGCGIAWLIGGDMSGISRNDAPFGYSVVSDGTDAGSDGKTYYCRDETLAHELGHNMGSQHDLANAGSSSGLYPYSYGYKSSWFYTIMAYGDDGQTTFRVFSNPRIAYCGGQPCGIANNADNAQSLNRAVPVVAQFRNAVVAPPRLNLPQLDADGNGRSDLFFSQASSGDLAVWYMSGTTRVSYASYLARVASYRLVDSGDMAGDGRGDLLYRDSSNFLLHYYSTGAGFEGRTMADKVPPDWKPVAMIDINGDRKTSEVVLHNPYTGSGAIWFYADGYRAKYNGFSVPAIYTFVDSGDLNGDGRSDVVWTDVSGRILISVSNGSALAAAVQAPYAYDRTYSLAAVSDVNGDGRSDLVFWKASTRQLAVWFMQGTSRIGYFGSIVPAGFWPVGRGDFNGDRRGDLVWSDASRRIMLSLSSGAAYSYYVLPYVVASGWTTMGVN
jgi:peptidyl-Asp metalloendopeptidase